MSEQAEAPDTARGLLTTVAFEVTSDKPMPHPIEYLQALADEVERALRLRFPDFMIRRLEPDQVLDTEVWR